MSCFYCGKRVSLVRKRVDADFCCEEHREKYHARTRRGMDRLLEAEERMATTRRLSEGFPLRGNAPVQGAALADLVKAAAGALEPFRLIATGLPVSRAILLTQVPSGHRVPVRVAHRSRTVPAPRVESAPWKIALIADDPEPPKPFTVRFGLPRSGLLAETVNGKVHDRSRCPKAYPGTDAGLGAHAVMFPKTDPHRTQSIAALMRAVRPPDPVTPPPARPPIVAALRPPVMSLTLGAMRTGQARVHPLEPGLVSLQHAPVALPIRPARLVFVRFVPRPVVVPAAPFRARGMQKPAEWKGVTRFVPCLEGFRRRQFYDLEPLDRFCVDVAFATIGDHRPEIKIVAAPNTAAHHGVADLWVVRADDRETAAPEPRRPGPPFHERVSLPVAVSPTLVNSLPEGVPAARTAPRLDLTRSASEGATWERIAGVFPLAHRQGAPLAIHSVEWVSSTSSALPLPGVPHPHTHGAKRTACVASIKVRPPVYSGPLFVPGRCQTGPASAMRYAAPLHRPAAAPARSERVISARAPLIAEEPVMRCGLRQSALLARACTVPMGKQPAGASIQPPCRITRRPLPPAGRVSSALDARLLVPPPLIRRHSAFDIEKGTTRLIGRQALARFQSKAYEGMASRHTTPHWPAASAPGLLAHAAQQPCPHPSRLLDREPAAAMFRACDPPRAAAFVRACSLMDSALAAPTRPAAAEFGRDAHPDEIPFAEPVRLPIDSLGPIRDWGLAPPPQPEQPPEPINEDFAAGLANWLGATSDWKQDIAGVRTGSLALLQPSLNLTDYELEFLGKIENRSIGWVFRATNTDHYYAAKIVMGESSGSTEFIRYSVIGGDEEPPVSVPLEFQLQKNSSCRVKMSVRGSDFTVFVNDKPAGQWSDDRLPEGGVGFFSTAEDRARLYWVKVTPLRDESSEELYAQLAPVRSKINLEIRMGV